MKVSFITTVYNEEKTVEPFLDSLFQQTRLPDEIIIVDGGSRDGTVGKINELRLKSKDYKGRFAVFTKKGNRSIGRNEAIRNAKGDIIVCSDAGNILDKNWIKEIINPFANSEVAVVAGYYKGLAKNIFQKCLIPYVLVMPDKVDPENFLPATRSVAFRKSAWKKVGGFDERLSHNEDYAFAKALQKIHTKIVFEKKAIVYWIPRTDFKQSFIMFFRFAYGDAESKNFRPKVLLLFIRYIVALILLLYAIIEKSNLFGGILLLLLLCYIVWAIVKNYKYVNNFEAIVFLPLLQFTADFAVLSGTFLGATGLLKL